VFVLEHPAGLAEYAMAKAAGEVLCQDLNTQPLGIKVRVVRLPRLLTDQTASVASADFADAAALLLPILIAME
jgi:hypothetical protein